MFKKKTTITHADRDRLLELTQSKATALRWALFIDELRREIHSARVVAPHRIAPDVVTMHSTMRLFDLARGTEETYTLVYPEEMDLSAGRLSVLSPLGTAVLGCREGDIVNLVGAAGPRSIKIQSVIYQPETARRNDCVVTREELS